jgi:putative nucleotidyltransferase with HDIG domain
VQASIRVAPTGFNLSDESDAIRWMHEEVERRGELPLMEAETVVRSLSLAMHSDQEMLIPLLQLKEYDQYTTTHSLNVSVLSMALAEFMGLAAADVRAFGVAGLLHDIGKVRIPREVLTKPGARSPEERALIQTHATEGAKILSARGIGNSLAATVAYEHHMWFNGKGGYPRFTFPRETHFASRIVHVADIYDAVCSKRPYGDAWPRDRAIELIASLGGVELDPRIAAAFVRMASGATELRSQVSEQRG